MIRRLARKGVPPAWGMAGPAPLRAFSLTEVVLALGVVSFALIAAMGLIPLGLTSLKDSAEDTANSLLVGNIRETLVGFPFVAGDLGPFYYDANGKYLGETLDGQSHYKVAVTLAPPAQTIAYTNLLVASVTISWPATMTATQSNQSNQYKTSFFVAPMSGSGWQALDPAYQPKIGL